MNQYQTNTLVQNNLIGAKIDELDALKYIIPNAADLFNTITRLQYALEDDKTIALTHNEQNIISTGINSFNTLKGAKILNNIFYSNKDNEETNGYILQDHVTYLRGTSDVVIAGNHVRGWFNGSFGGFKFKSSVGITIMNNYMRNTGVIMADDPEYGPIPEAQSVSMYKDVLIANNTIDYKYWDGGYGMGFEFGAYRQPEQTSISNGVFVNNRFVHMNNLFNLDKPWSSVKPDLQIYNTALKSGFHPRNNSYETNNTRDDSVNNGMMKARGWTADDYASMNQDGESIYKPERYDTYLSMPIPEKNTLPIAVPTTIIQGDSIESISLITHYDDKDETGPVAKVLNASNLDIVGEQKIQVELQYPTGFICVIKVPVTVEAIP